MRKIVTKTSNKYTLPADGLFGAIAEKLRREFVIYDDHRTSQTHEHDRRTECTISES